MLCFNRKACTTPCMHIDWVVTNARVHSTWHVAFCQL